MSEQILTELEKEIATLLAEGHTQKNICRMKNISETVCRKTLKNLVAKLNVKNKLQAILELVKQNRINTDKVLVEV